LEIDAAGARELHDCVDAAVAIVAHARKYLQKRARNPEDGGTSEKGKKRYRCSVNKESEKKKKRTFSRQEKRGKGKGYKERGS
jgi:hypothetical protein